MTDTIRAEITDKDHSHFCTAEGRTVKASAPVLAMCRELIEAGFDPSRPLEAYRGDILCLRVSSIGHGAKLTVEESPNGPVLRRWRPRERPVGASPVHSDAPPLSPWKEAPLRKGRRYIDIKMAGTYTRIRLGDNRLCVYCGHRHGSTWDHVYPVSSAATLADLGIEIDQRLKLMVRACPQCNSTAGSLLFKSYPHKRAYIRETLLRRQGTDRLGPAPELPFIARPLEATQVSTFQTREGFFIFSP
jgi:hypothetical protein